MTLFTYVFLIWTLFTMSVISGEILGDVCFSGSDCPADECCKMFMTHIPIAPRGNCAKLKISGQDCFVLSGRPDGKPSFMVSQCPCLDGLTCKAPAGVPALGARGTCDQ